jgi:hypothetical protein
MKKYCIISLVLTCILSFHSFGQDTISNKRSWHDNYIKDGSYLKIGASLPTGAYATTQSFKVYNTADPAANSVIYPAAKLGGTLDVGYMIYIGPAFASNHLRAGIDATFFSLSFNQTELPSYPNGESEKWKFWYFYLGQKFGPVFTINPYDRIMIDLSYKLNAYIAYLHHQFGSDFKDDWGKNLLQSEVSINLRYRIILASFQYNFGDCVYDRFDTKEPSYKINTSTFRILVGFMFN